MNIRACHAPAILTAIAISIAGANHNAYGFQIAKDLREAMTGAVAGRASDAIDASRQLATYYGGRSKWAEVEPYMQCLFALSSERRRSSAGEQFRRR